MTEKMKKIGLISLSTIVALVISEIFLSVFKIADSFEILNTPLGQSGFILQNFKDRGRDSSWFNRLTSSPFIKDPFQIQDVTMSATDPEIKILFLGDSGTFGIGVKKEDVFSTLIQNKIKKDFPGLKFKVINAGVPGALPIDSLWIYDTYLLPLKPDIVIFTIFMANDLNQSYLQYNYKALKLNHTLASLTLYKLFYLFKLRLTQKTDNSLFSPVYPDRNDEFNMSILDFIDGEIATYNEPYSSQMKEAMNKFYHVLGKMRSLSEAANIPFIVSMIPTRSYLTDKLDIQPIDFDLKKNLEDRKFKNTLKLDFEKSLRLVRSHLKLNNYIFSDPTFKMKKVIGKDALTLNDDHLSPEGHQILADELYDQIKRFIKPGSP